MPACSSSRSLLANRASMSGAKPKPGAESCTSSFRFTFVYAMRRILLHAMAKREPRLIPLGYGKFVRADRIYALVPIEAEERAHGRRTYVHVDQLDRPIEASRSARAILADQEQALAEAAGLPRRKSKD